jgi:exonuclease III
MIKQYNFNGYDFHYNSDYASRGVGILIKKSLAFNIVDMKKDRIGNILILKVTGTEAETFLLCSVYGPNDNNGEFFADLNSFLASMDSNNIICGGDFNCTWDSSPVDSNIDTFAMRSIPSLYRTNKVRQIANDFNLTDPFRFFFIRIAENILIYRMRRQTQIGQE